MPMLEKWNLSKGKGDSFGALLIDLSKAFDCLLHELLIVKLAVYGFSRSALKLLYTYLFNKKQRTKISVFYSSLQDILSGISQGSILGPLLLTHSIMICSSLLITLILRVMQMTIHLTQLMKAPKKLCISLQ